MERIAIRRVEELPHGSENITEGRLTARTTSDYLAFACPACGGDLILFPVGLLEEAAVLGLKTECPRCGLRDNIKLPFGPG